ncbi:hypothetical protein [Kribbella solani]|uniref:Uncharacterized protein n=1 Tax=Kribbella solani TaxID=236067 RepID=A0A841DDZ8_9ACTN|nr:hypothetical protein [Kribbella solani]MBB5977294.1 hypothetical protein [Kribbella solani]
MALSTGKILDIFEGTQQIQQLIVARRLLGLTSAELKQPWYPQPPVDGLPRSVVRGHGHPGRLAAQPRAMPIRALRNLEP